MANKIISRMICVRSANYDTRQQQAAISNIVNELRSRSIEIDVVNKKTGEIEVSLKMGVWVDSRRDIGMYHVMCMVDDELTTLLISPDAEIVGQAIENHLKKKGKK